MKDALQFSNNPLQNQVDLLLEQILMVKKKKCISYENIVIFFNLQHLILLAFMSSRLRSTLVFSRFVTFSILFNNLIPISLTVTLEVQSNDKKQHFSLLGNTVLRCYCHRQLTDESPTDYRQITDCQHFVGHLVADT